MKNIVLNAWKSIDYTLIARVNDNGEVHEFVAAYAYDETDGTWCQGHYFEKMNDAMAYINGLVDEHIEQIQEQYFNDPEVQRGFHQQDIIDMYRAE